MSIFVTLTRYTIDDFRDKNASGYSHVIVRARCMHVGSPLGPCSSNDRDLNNPRRPSPSILPYENNLYD